MTFEDYSILTKIIETLEKTIKELKELQKELPITNQTTEVIQNMAADVKELKRQLT